jgi:hypothetical protein
MEFGMGFSRRLSWTHNLDCGRHCGDRKRFIVRADEKLTAFLELELAIRACGWRELSTVSQTP